MWSLKKIHRVGELLAAVAVVVSLLIVAYEVQQNSEWQRQGTTQELINAYTGILTLLTQNGDLRCAYIKGISDFDSLNGSEALAVSAYLLALMRHREDLYFQYLNGAVEPSIWAGFDKATREVMQRSGWQQWFARRRSWFSDEFQAYIDDSMGPPVQVNPFPDPGCPAGDGA